MKNSNRKSGNSFEHELCIKLSAKGFWAHNLAQNAAGQPFDVLAAKNGTSYAIDCKVCEHDVFKIERVEPNQDAAMTLWEQTGNGAGWFAFKMSDGTIWFVSHPRIRDLACLHKVLSYSQIVSNGYSLCEWSDGVWR